jgi:hypothetical protein
MAVNDQHVARGAVDDLSRGRAEEPIDPAIAVAAEHDQIDVELVCNRKDCAPRLRSDFQPWREQAFRGRGTNDGDELGPRLLGHFLG